MDRERFGRALVDRFAARAGRYWAHLDETLLPEVAPTHAFHVLGAVSYTHLDVYKRQDPLYVANEGVFVAVVPSDEAAAALAAARALPGGEGAALIGTVAPDPEGLVVIETRYGGTRVVDMLVGDPLPRIC